MKGTARDCGQAFFDKRALTINQTSHLGAIFTGAPRYSVDIRFVVLA
jgi:hypothetical protein